MSEKIRGTPFCFGPIFSRHQMGVPLIFYAVLKTLTISKQQKLFNSAEHGLRTEIEKVDTALARANVRIQNQSTEISSLHSLRQKGAKLAGNQETKLKQFLNEKKNLNQRISNLESTLKCPLCYEIVRYTSWFTEKYNNLFSLMMTVTDWYASNHVDICYASPVLKIL